MGAVRDEILDAHPKGTVHPPIRRREPNWEIYMPLIYAPSLPLLRLALNGRVRPVVRDRVFFSAVMVALGHAGIIMSRDSSMGAGT